MDTPTAIFNMLVMAMQSGVKLNRRKIDSILTDALKADPDGFKAEVANRAKTVTALSSVVETKRQLPNCNLTIAFKWHEYQPPILIGFGKDGRFVTENEVE